MGLKLPHKRTVGLVALVLSTVLVQIVVAILLKELADAGRSTLDTWTILVLVGVAGLNGIRFLVWAFTHKHFPLSRSYPLTALFFPCILLLSAWYGESINWRNVAGVAIIMIGIATMSWDSDEVA